ncbi:hypothetical protein IGB42_03399 [Andreprevotia sp. IGB-42]|uniref:DcrB-related protein n=1 Tax=Andreprevotia sp. IGB-42 TaxID=2497473 RepID=UPI00135BBF36|nr:DcrB-related protein [Andreprevotia sp. IGB-42]KAF0812122.1 hypothetical protein IGB42_03399 [Andreprevotia sp. IGB-42]
MNYLINEALFKLPDPTPTDYTINMIKLNQLGANLAIGRGQMQPDETSLEENVKRQLEALDRQVSSLRIQNQSACQIGENLQYPAFEIQSRFVRGNEIIYQHQVILQIPDTDKTLVFTYSKPTAMNEQDAQAWQAIKSSIRLAQANPQ